MLAEKMEKKAEDRKRNLLGRYIKDTVTIYKKCIICKNEIKTYQCLKNRKKYCSWKCRNKGLIPHMLRHRKSPPFGEKHPNWNNGIYHNKHGYIMLLSKKHPSGQKYVMEHRLVMEKHLGRYLKQKEVVHHINNNPSDNRIENLKVFANDNNHKKFHAQNRKYLCGRK